MSRDFPDWINPWTAAQGRRRFSGTVPVTRMRRLVPLLVTDAGEAAFEAGFELDEDRRPVIRLRVKAVLRLLCQASLEPYDQAVERDSALAVIESESEISMLAPDNDPVQADHGRIALAALVEDELLLGLPQVPRNPDVIAIRYEAGEATEQVGDVSEKDTPPAEERENPFAVLQGKLGSKPEREPGGSGS